MLKALALALALALAVPTLAHAKAEREVQHRFEQVWPTAVRHIRIDEGHKIIDKDEGSGYLLFEVADDGKTYRGSLELIRAKGADDRPVVRMLLTIEDRPAYMESAILDRLITKLRKEHGEAEVGDDDDQPPAPEPEPEPAPGDPVVE